MLWCGVPIWYYWGLNYNKKLQLFSPHSQSQCPMIRRDGDKEIPEPFADEVIVVCNNCQCFFFNCLKTPVIRIFVSVFSKLKYVQFCWCFLVTCNVHTPPPPAQCTYTPSYWDGNVILYGIFFQPFVRPSFSQRAVCYKEKSK